ncbi:hypothetical protein E5F05_20290 [Deinococcus metallilatus]|uniref:Uncharacterized protein n=1 Tax=Deinococcus metallilatus TaxID=1211322 RepID=A0AAJ5F1F3_9DEIO|nr:hypothetical protein [Deinococcus metallilatus]MBB5297137.1 hypothetical protein [Deinococcus metallilatus]QBY10077.1 hypothetical protein E5F05_20290 [Deinococcus metallilatus]RXJ08332.1 hypothetical protein ERJ73_19130 [Deinococcus metallilatus]TLK21958.1 hypothetical protein FCS05_18355 [Deinococcus metallilatus]GMA17298.1 hypothetical protein GCM10025871_36290 [Deinococcus metallilatus]
MKGPVPSLLLAAASGAVAALLTWNLLQKSQRKKRHGQEKPVQFGEIDVQRINVREADSTLRLVISNRGRLPGAYNRGREYAHLREQAGLLFFNDEGTENGGLIFGGQRGADGQGKHGLHLSFDRYEQDQTIFLSSGELFTGDGVRQYRTLNIVDRPEWPIKELVEVTQGKQGEELEQAVKGFFQNHEEAQPRLLLGKKADQTVGLRLFDPQGRPRLVLQVDPQGTPVLQFLDEAGRTVKQLP